MRRTRILILTLFLSIAIGFAQQDESRKISLARIFTGEFSGERAAPIQWISNGDAYIIVERSSEVQGGQDLIKYQSATQKSSVFLSANQLTIDGNPIYIEAFSLNSDESKVLVFTNSSRVWRTNTKGDYYVYDLRNQSLNKIGKDFPSSSLMFAKFSADESKIAYVNDFNIYVEDLQSGKVTALTEGGNSDQIYGTFDWVYEEEFGKRDGFAWNPNREQIAFWHLDASSTRTFYMINNTDSVYSEPIPIKYPKVGQPPSGARIGLKYIEGNDIYWLPLPGDPYNSYIPGMQWVNDDLLLVQQLNRLQNKLNVWKFIPSTKELTAIYTEENNSWIDLSYPDVASNHWGESDLDIVDNGKSFLRMSETDSWRRVFKIDIATGQSTTLTRGEYDVAAKAAVSSKNYYFIASPDNSTQRYLYVTDLAGKGKTNRLTPENFEGVNLYNISPNGKYAIHTSHSSSRVSTIDFISLPNHKVLKSIMTNERLKSAYEGIDMPEVRFTEVTSQSGITMDVRMILPPGFDESKEYPVLFYTYGEPWGQKAVDMGLSVLDILWAQMGYVIVSLDNRGTPCLKGSEWRKSIYGKVGQINVQDQAEGAMEVLKLPYLDKDRVGVWGWSGGGTMTLNLMFKYPEVYGTGIAVAAVSNQLIYDNIYQERYMGLPQENMDRFIKGSPITHAKGLEGNLMIIHGTGDDNVHYQSVDMLVNELVKHNKQFRMMAYPNRSHGIYEGAGTSRHLYTLITNYLAEMIPVNE